MKAHLLEGRLSLLSWDAYNYLVPSLLPSLTSRLPLSLGQCDQTGRDSNGMTVSPSHPHHQF